MSAVSDPRPTPEGQLPLPIAADPVDPASATRRRTRRSRAADSQLWLFAPYAQPELPLRSAAEVAHRPAVAQSPAEAPTPRLDRVSGDRDG